MDNQFMYTDTEDRTWEGNIKNNYYQYIGVKLSHESIQNPLFKTKQICHFQFDSISRSFLTEMARLIGNQP